MQLEQALPAACEYRSSRQTSQYFGTCGLELNANNLGLTIGVLGLNVGSQVTPPSPLNSD
jgi:hypothetical protein